MVSLELNAVEKDPVRLKPTVVFAPTSQEFEQEFVSTKNHLILTTLEDVQGRAYIYTHGSDGSWTRKRLPVGDNQTIGIAAREPNRRPLLCIVVGFPHSSVAVAG